VDIFEDGALDLPDTALAKLDLVVGAVHARFNLSRARQTERILAALENPRLSILAHPTGGVVLELNAHPDRLDLNDAHCRMARDMGVLVSIGTDARSVDGLADLRYGIGQARRGWLGKAQVLDARPLAAVKRVLARRTATTEAR
jgi:DNA polymerase (family 10)